MFRLASAILIIKQMTLQLATDNTICSPTKLYLYFCKLKLQYHYRAKTMIVI